MSQLLTLDPFNRRDDAALLSELNALTQHHLNGCPEYARLFPRWKPVKTLAELPFLHVGLFKRLSLKTQGTGVQHQRVLNSSSTSGMAPSEITLDTRSSGLQALSVQAIHRAVLGEDKRPLLILDEAQALRQRALSARLAAALSLQPLASETQFLLEKIAAPEAVRWDTLTRVLEKNRSILLYGTTWALWQAMGDITPPSEVKTRLRETRIDFVHSGGWKKLEAQRVDHRQFENRLLEKSASGSRVVDYYGLSEQVGMLFPLCSRGRRHAPAWADVLVRDIYTLEPVENKPGLLQLMNPLAWGAPYHNVLTEDMGQRASGACGCGWSGRHFELLGRVPQAEIRGAALPEKIHLHRFETPQATTLVALPFRLDDLIRGWTDLRKVMVRQQPETFTRDEWGYLISFLNVENLERPFIQSFGKRAAGKRPAQHLMRPRGPVSVWLPNNVSLLGPLSLILLSLTGNSLRFKAGSRSSDLTLAFLEFCRRHVSGVLAAVIKDRVVAGTFDREDARNTEMSAQAQLRIAFGSDAAVDAIHALPHPRQSIGFGFSDRQSQAWVEPKALKEAALIDLIKVFAVYGQAGCTSPQKVVVLGNRREALALRDALIKLWPKVIRREAPMDLASENLMASQWAGMNGWDAALAPRQQAVLAVGDMSAPGFQGRMALPLVYGSRDQARAQLPANIQTLGHAVKNPGDSAWMDLLSASAVKRFVPLAAMHHFGAVWDGWTYWRESFEDVELNVSPRAT